MPLFLVPAIAGTHSYLTREEAGDYTAGSGGRELDAYQIYVQLNSGPGIGSLTEGQSAAGELKSSFEQRISQMDAVGRKMDEAWEGESSQAAKAGAHPLKQWLQDSQGKLDESDQTLASQADAFNNVVSRVQPVPEKPPEGDFINDIKPWETDTDRDIKDYNGKAQANVEAYNAYYSASKSNSDSLPKYTTVDGNFGDVSVDDSGEGDGSANGIGGEVGGSGPGGSGPGGNVPGGSAPSGGMPGGSGPGGSYPGGGMPGGSTPGGSYPGGNVPGGSYPGGGGPGFGPGDWDDSTSASGFTPPSGSSDFNSRGVGNLPGPNGLTGGPGLSGGGPGGGPGGGAGGGIGPAGGAAFGVPGAGAGAAGAGAASGPGASAGATPGASAGAGAGRAAMGGPGAMGGGGAAAGGRGGMPMGAMGGGRGAKGADDEEHQTKYLVEEDGDSIFGSDELTAPPVIGE